MFSWMALKRVSAFKAAVAPGHLTVTSWLSYPAAFTQPFHYPPVHIICGHQSLTTSGTKWPKIAKRFYYKNNWRGLMGKQIYDQRSNTSTYCLPKNIKWELHGHFLDSKKLFYFPGSASCPDRKPSRRRLLPSRSWPLPSRSRLLLSSIPVCSEPSSTSPHTLTPLWSDSYL